MVIPVGPGKFYGGSLPRPRYFTNPERVDPPVSVLDPLLSWATEAHWSMGGLSFKRLRLQGRIEGNVNKLRAASVADEEFESKSGIARRPASVSPPTAPMVSKRRRFMAVLDEEEEEVVKKGNGGSGSRKERRNLARKLGGDFDRVASENPIGETLVTGSSPVQTRSRISELDSIGDLVMKVVHEVNGETLKSGNSSPASSTRLARRGST